MKMKNKKRGFTLIELMLVMIIMGVLAAIGVTAFISSQVKGRDSARKGNLKAISQALELYYNDKGAYPVASSGYIKACMSGGVAENCDGTDAQHKTMTDGTTIYMANMPKDPVASDRYYYVSTNGKQFQLYAHLENTQDLQLMTPAASGTSCGGACNYGVSSADTNP